MGFAQYFIVRIDLGVDIRTRSSIRKVKIILACVREKSAAIIELLKWDLEQN